MTRKELYKAAAKAAGVTQRTSQAVLDAAIELMSAELAAGQAITLKHFGTIQCGSERISLRPARELREKCYPTSDRRKPASGVYPAWLPDRRRKHNETENE